MKVDFCFKFISLIFVLNLLIYFLDFFLVAFFSPLISATVNALASIALRSIFISLPSLILINDSPNFLISPFATATYFFIFLINGKLRSSSSFSNVFISPHVGGNTSAFEPRARKLIESQLEKFAAGLPLDNVVAVGK